MKPLGVSSVAFLIAVLLSTLQAQASPFCPADVVSMVPWSFSADAPAPTSSSAHYSIRLKDDGTDVLSGHVTLAGASRTYTMTFTDVRFTYPSDPSAAPDPIGDEYGADGTFVSLPAPDAIRYAWVSDVTDSTGATTKCPIFPYRLRALTATQRSAMTSVPPPMGVHLRYDATMAQAAALLPPASCRHPYREVAPVGAGPRYTQFFDRSIVGKPVVFGAAAVDPTGKVIATAVLKSSGSQVYDNAAKEEYGVRKFKRALFDCQPAAGIFYFYQEYYYQR